MKYKGQIFAVAAAIVLVLVLFLLPKGVVKQERAAPGQPSTAAKTEPSGAAHAPDSLPAAAKQAIAAWRDRITQEPANLAWIDSLSGVFLKHNQFDSAAVWLATMARKQAAGSGLLRAGDGFADAAGFALDQAKSDKLLDSARKYYNLALSKDTHLVEAKVKLGLTYINTQNPMQGILMIRSVADKNPDNQLAQYHLGILAIRSGQYNKAMPRFEKLIRLSPKQGSYFYYLGVCQKNLGQKNGARQSFETARKLSQDPAVLASVEEQMQDMQPN